MPTVSVIIPNYNYAAYLPQRIESVLRQTYPDFEVILLDDCSQDDSRAIMERYREHPKVSHLVFTAQNSGSPFKQWEKGISLASGEWVWIAESDDWCEATFLEEMVALAEKYPAAVLGYCQSLVVREEEILYRTQTPPYLSSHASGRDWIIQNMLGICVLENASMAVFRKSHFAAIDKRFVHLKQCGDQLFWCELAQKGEVAISGKCLNYFRKHAANVTSTKWAEGYYYLEGSDLFKRAIAQLQLQEAEIFIGLEKFLLQLWKDRPLFGEEKFKKLFEAVVSIHPQKGTEIWRRFRKEEQKLKVKERLKKLLP